LSGSKVHRRREKRGSANHQGLLAITPEILLKQMLLLLPLLNPSSCWLLEGKTDKGNIEEEQETDLQTVVGGRKEERKDDGEREGSEGSD
jgi:hypothetical protein